MVSVSFGHLQDSHFTANHGETQPEFRIPDAGFASCEF